MKKYKYYESPNIVVAVRNFGNKKIKGVAKCSPNDQFDIEIGKALASLRCEKKMAKEKLKEATFEFEVTEKMLLKLLRQFNKSKTYMTKCKDNYNEIVNSLEEFENKLR